MPSMVLSSHFPCQSCNSYQICLLCLVDTDCVLRLKIKKVIIKKINIYILCFDVGTILCLL